MRRRTVPGPAPVLRGWVVKGTLGSCVWVFDGYTLVLVHQDKIDDTRPQRRAA